MKQKDIALIVVIVIISAFASFMITKHFIATPKSRKQTAEVVQPITDDFPSPDSHYFNSQAFDPTKQITIGENSNPDPFKGASQ